VVAPFCNTYVFLLCKKRVLLHFFGVGNLDGGSDMLVLILHIFTPEHKMNFQLCWPFISLSFTTG